MGTLAVTQVFSPNRSRNAAGIPSRHLTLPRVSDMPDVTRWHRYVVTLSAVIAPLVAGLSAQAPTAVLLNGRIFTGDSTRPWVEALAIRGDRVLAIGTSAEITRLATSSTQRYDLG